MNYYQSISTCICECDNHSFACYKLGIWHFELTHKTRPGDNCQKLSPTILRMVTYQPKHGHPRQAQVSKVVNFVGFCKHCGLIFLPLYKYIVVNLINLICLKITNLIYMLIVYSWLAKSDLEQRRYEQIDIFIVSHSISGRLAGV